MGSSAGNYEKSNNIGKEDPKNKASHEEKVKEGKTFISLVDFYKNPDIPSPRNNNNKEASESKTPVSKPVDEMEEVSIVDPNRKRYRTESTQQHVSHGGLISTWSHNTLILAMNTTRQQVTR